MGNPQAHKVRIQTAASRMPPAMQPTVEIKVKISTDWTGGTE